MRKGIQPALEQYLVTAGGGEGAAVAAAAAAATASMDKRALLASPGFPAAAAAAPGAYLQILTTNTSTTSCSSSLHSGAGAAGPLLPSAPGAELTAGSLLYTTPHGPSGRAGLLQQPPALGRGGGGPPVMPSGPHRPQPGREVGCSARGGGRAAGRLGAERRGGLIVSLAPGGSGGSAGRAGQRGLPWRGPRQTLGNFSRAPLLFQHFSLPPPSPPLPSNSKLPLSRA